MTSNIVQPADSSPPVGPADLATQAFAPWVDWHRDECRRGRTLITAVNTRTSEVVQVDDADLAAATAPVSTERRGALELRERAFLAGAAPPPITPPSSPPGSGLVWRGADRFVRRLHDAGLSRAMEPRWLAVQLAVAVAGGLATLVVVQRQPIHWRATPYEIPIIIALGLVAVAIHEVGHALVTVHHGRHVHMVGLRLHLGSPAFYVESIDALLLTRRQRLAQAAAGPWAEWLVNALIAFVTVALPSDCAAATILQRFVIVNAIGIAVNLLPFVGLDGSMLLADLIREPDLTIRAREGLLHPRSLARNDRWLLVYALANLAVAATLAVSAVFFWWQLFGDLFTTLWHWGPPGAALVGLAAVALSGALPHVTPPLRHACRRSPLLRRARFRLERRWRVRATKAFLRLPDLAELDAPALGVIAGRLERLAAATRLTAPGHVFVPRSRSVVRVGSGWVAPGRRTVFLPDAMLRPTAAPI